MSNKKLLKHIAAVAGAACLALTVLASPVATVHVQASEPGDEGIMPYKDDIEWRYKVENGNLYRRLYNYMTNAWIGPWEYIGPYNP